MLYSDDKKIKIPIPDSDLSDIAEIDYYIAKAIWILNKKGYRTEYCCSGHEKWQTVLEPKLTGYVAFNCEIPYPPKGWWIEKLRHSYTNPAIKMVIRYNGLKSDCILKKSKLLLRWAKQLPINENINLIKVVGDIPEEPLQCSVSSISNY